MSAAATPTGQTSRRAACPCCGTSLYGGRGLHVSFADGRKARWYQIGQRHLFCSACGAQLEREAGWMYLVYLMAGYVLIFIVRHQLKQLHVHWLWELLIPLAVLAPILPLLLYQFWYRCVLQAPAPDQSDLLKRKHAAAHAAQLPPPRHTAPDNDALAALTAQFGPLPASYRDTVTTVGIAEWATPQGGMLQLLAPSAIATEYAALQQQVDRLDDLRATVLSDERIDFARLLPVLARDGSDWRALLDLDSGRVYGWQPAEAAYFDDVYLSLPQCICTLLDTTVPAEQG
ncbi:hypothetical protein [Andreprevotia lacus]|nr:hypothetical protein [Andreprevotia lacus]